MSHSLVKQVRGSYFEAVSAGPGRVDMEARRASSVHSLAPDGQTSWIVQGEIFGSNLARRWRDAWAGEPDMCSAEEGGG